ncbi:MAG: translation initiation factor IF-2 N-terminal domain-containing protein, partial [Synergistaceae bacterium]|nr:translation initiation factor IF-2 N-terminal domain-containing protein [Synergistaceae bacterium]
MLKAKQRGELPLNNKIRIYELAKKLNKSNKELLAVLQQLDIPVKSHSSSIDE